MLVEVLVSATLLTVAMLAALSTLTAGFGAIDAARRSSEAMFLADERLEQVRGLLLGTRPIESVAQLATERFPGEPYGAIPGHRDYRRLTEVEVAPAGPSGMGRVTVTVFYRRPGVGAAPGMETFERLTALVALP